ncbi:MAG: SPOR domain-containing protein [Rhodobacteraceae bacterium]|nr:SPOR domain-containing protein [Paracoccaceae bacterium]
MSRPLSNIFLLIVLFVGSMSEAVAQSLTSSEGPANLPPADFTGTQFVDNKGCVHIRTGRTGATSWTPRVSRDRKLVCGFEPSFAGTSAVPLRQKPAIVAQKPISSPLSSIPVKQTSSTLPPKKTVPSTRATPAAQSYAQTTTSNGREIILNGSGMPSKIPNGFRAAWDDGRLNLNRGIPTAAGIVDSEKIWTQNIPRQLISDVAQGNVYPVKRVLTYPFKSMETQERFMAAKGALSLKVAQDGEISMNRSAAATRISSKSMPATVTHKNGQSIQVATLANPLNAERTILRMAKLNLPTTNKPVTIAGRSYQIVLVGPFYDQESSKVALKTVHQEGFRDAFFR